jgi:hypothetical protein
VRDARKLIFYRRIDLGMRMTEREHRGSA